MSGPNIGDLASELTTEQVVELAARVFMMRERELVEQQIAAKEVDATRLNDPLYYKWAAQAWFDDHMRFGFFLDIEDVIKEFTQGQK